MLRQPEAFFLPASLGRPGQRFCIFHATHGREPKGCILYIHPFAEETNKSRRMAAPQSRELARAGYAVLQIDLLGYGDSSGSFGDATWDGWLQDVAQGAQWLLNKVDEFGESHRAFGLPDDLLNILKDDLQQELAS